LIWLERQPNAGEYRTVYNGLENETLFAERCGSE